MNARWALLLILLASACGHPKPVHVQVRERAYYGIAPEAEDGDVLCVPSEQAGPPMVCVSIGQVKAYIRQQRYAP